MTNPNDPIYPLMTEMVDKVNGKGSDVYYANLSLTKREYFAALALQGILADTANADCSQDTMALYAVGCADALIERLNKTSYNPSYDL